MFSRTENLQTFTRSYPVVSLFILIQVALFVIEQLNAFFNFGFSPLNYGAAINLFIGNGEWWRVVTATFLHYDFWHIAFNTFALIIFAPALERMIGHAKFASFYLLVGTLANVLTYFTKINEPFYGQAGASGAILGLLGFYVYLGRFKRTVISADDARLVYIFSAITAIFTLLGSNVSVFGHLYGFVLGFLAGFIFGKGTVPFTRPFNTGRRPASGGRIIHTSGSGQLGRIIFYVIVAFAVFGLLARFI
ncbi:MULTISPECIES: rhomboid family intramembrane serine protease [unclassified Exiguobacterium]|uniref:rhomboid family intramembrane serine protease n=2 Tax=Exiguobacterium TaxID=33986 RepID=UPI001BE8BBA8|nr:MULTISPECIES: rhomboid family intramembrane serine protease [unclassified Exiguobacterium]